MKDSGLMWLLCFKVWLPNLQIKNLDVVSASVMVNFMC